MPESALKFRRLSRFLPPTTPTVPKSTTSSWRAMLVATGPSLVVCSTDISDVIQRQEPEQDRVFQMESSKEENNGLDKTDPEEPEGNSTTGLQTCICNNLLLLLIYLHGYSALPSTFLKPLQGPSLQKCQNALLNSIQTFEE